MIRLTSLYCALYFCRRSVLAVSILLLSLLFTPSPLQAQDLDPVADIQREVTNGDDSRRSGDTVTVQGVVTGVYGGLFFVQASDGEWSGIAVYAPGHEMIVGNEVRVTGPVVEYYDLTEIEPTSIELVAQAAPLPSPATGSVQAIGKEAWEGVLVRLDDLTVTSGPNQYGEWRVGDDTGEILVDDKGVFYDATVGEEITSLIGIVDHAFGSYRILPRTIDDIVTAQDQALQPEELTPIYAIQGNGASTPLSGERVSTRGLVTGVTVDGFFLQDTLGDGDPQTSDGIYVYLGAPPEVEAGDCVVVRLALADEYYGKTELNRAQTVEASDQCPAEPPTPVEISLPAFAADQASLYESLEGMLVSLPAFSGSVQGPTKRFADGSAEIGIVAAELAPYLPGGRVFQEEEEHVAALIFLTNQVGAVLPNVGWGDSLAISGPATDSDDRDPDPVLGLLDYNFGKYQLALLPEQTSTVTRTQTRHDRIDAPAADEFTVCTFNLLGMGRGSAQYPDEATYAVQLDRRARVIAEDLRGCTIVGLQETGTPADALALADLLATQYQVDYTAVSLPGPNTDDSEFPLTMSLLARSDVVTVVQSTTLQTCSPVDYEVNDDDACADGSYPLFDRPPLIVDMTVSGAFTGTFSGAFSDTPYPLTVIVNHWKSKAGDESINVLRRTLQAQSVAEWIDTRLQEDAQANVVVLGDLNDYYASAPVDALQQGVTPPLIHTYDMLPMLDRYTYIYNGASQVLDHILISASMRRAFAGVDPLHINADFPTPTEEVAGVTNAAVRNHVSDHDPVQLTLRPAGAGWIGGAVGVPGVLVTLRNADGDGVGVAISDDRGDFRFWGLPPGSYRVDYKPPRGVTIQSPDRLLRVLAGAGLFLQPDVQIDQGIFGIEAILAGAAITGD